MSQEQKTFARQVRDFNGDVYLALPGTSNKFVRVDKDDLAEAGDHHGDLWVLNEVGSIAIVTANNEPPVGALA